MEWLGIVTSVQPRIRLLRSFDQRSHAYLGYVLQIEGRVGDSDDSSFWIAVGKAAHAKHQFRVGDTVSGRSAPVHDTRKESAAYYKSAGIKVLQRAEKDESIPPPWHTIAPDLEVYRERGHRRLSARTYGSNCMSCIWGCRMAVEITVDHWNPGQKRYRSETFCYGPKACPLYKAGPTRKVPGRKGMSWEEEDWVDEDATAHRTDDE